MLLALLACGHEAAFRPGAYGADGPFAPGPEVRLTFNPGADRTPTWLPDGDGVVYSVERLDRPDGDRCLAELPPRGGQIRRSACRPAFAGLDSIDAWDAFAVAPDGRIAFVWAVTPRHSGALTPLREALVRASLARPDSATVLQGVPYLGPSGRPHQAIGQVRWLGGDTLVYLGQRRAHPRACSGCAPDTVEWGVEIVVMDLSGPAPVLTQLPGSDDASSVALGGSPDTVYFTRNGDGRVFRHVPGTGVTTIAHDFGAGRIARDVQVAGGRLVAVVDGDVVFETDPVLGPVQRDGGGHVWMVDLSSGAETLLAGARLYRRPALSPDGRAVVVEAQGPGPADLWLLELP